jgi:predicted permease
MGGDTVIRLARGAVSAAFRAFPPAFREQHRIDALLYFEDRARDCVRNRGMAGLVGLTVRNVWDAVASGLAERRREGRSAGAGRGRHSWRWGLLTEVLYGLRSLRKQPGFLVATSVPVALGIAGVTAVFAVVDGVLLRPLPYADAGSLVAVGRPLPNGNLGPVSAANVIDIEGTIPGLVAVGGALGGSVVLTGEKAEIVRVLRPTRAFRETFGVEAGLGRTFTESDFESPGVAMITWSFWQRRWGGDPGVLGSVIDTDNGSFEIVGVLPRRWRNPELMMGGDGELWLPVDYTSQRIQITRAFGFGSAFGRLADGASLGVVNEQLRAAAESLWKQYPDANSERDGSPKMLEARPLRAVIAGDIGPRLALLLGAVGMLLAIACANVANLFLARGAQRERELAVRAVLGSGRGRLVAQALAESVVVAFAGGALGLVLAYMSLDTLVALTPELPRADAVRVDLRVAGAAFLLSLLSGVAFGLVPALTTSQRDPGGVLRGGSQPRPGTDRLRAGLVIGQTALALVLVTGGGLLVNSLVRLSRVNPGFRADGVLTLRPRTTANVFGGEDAPAAPFYDRLSESLAAIPGVTAVTGSVFVPGQTLPLVVTIDHPSTGDKLSRWSHTVLPGFFDVLEIPILEGRAIDATEVAGGMTAAVVSRALARELWPGESPLGRQMRVENGASAITYTVIGMAGDIRNSGPHDPPEPVFYDAFPQNPWLASLDMMIRHDGDAAALVPAVREAVRSVDPTVLIEDMSPLPAILAENTVETRHYAILLGVFSLIALAIAAVGVYATVSYAVTRRLREMGIRRAVGARGSDVATLVLRRAMLQAAAGAAIGLSLALAAARSLESLLFEITPADPATYAIVVAVLLAAALAACAAPAIRATRADPLAILRTD